MVGSLLTRFNSLSYRLVSGNVKPNALLRQFKVDKEPAQSGGEATSVPVSPATSTSPLIRLRMAYSSPYRLGLGHQWSHITWYIAWKGLEYLVHWEGALKEVVGSHSQCPGPLDDLGVPSLA